MPVKDLPMRLLCSSLKKNLSTFSITRFMEIHLQYYLTYDQELDILEIHTITQYQI